MKKFTKAIVLFGFALAFASNTSFAQFTITLDEFGGPNTSFPSLLGPDPSGGVAGPVLIYLLPFAVTPGDVILSEPGLPPTPDSDVVRFWNPAGNPNQSEIIFYSDVSAADPADAPADVGLPTQFQALTIRITETGPEGNNGAVYLPAAGMPGSTSAPMQYNIISDGVVPEPSSLALLLGGVGVLFGIKRFRR
jgi:hypothetical protein